MVQAAVDGGIRILGMADHCPYPGVSGPAAGVRMTLEQTQGYFDSFAALRDAFAGQVDLHIGFEAEYFPDLFEGMLDFLADYPCEYLILGSTLTAARAPYIMAGPQTTRPCWPAMWSR